MMARALGAVVLSLLLVGCTGTDNAPTESNRASPAPTVVTAGYALSGVEVVPGTTSGEPWRLRLDVAWVESGDPKRAGCSYTVYDDGGEVVSNGTFTLFVGSGPEAGLETPIDPPSGDAGGNYTASISCV